MRYIKHYLWFVKASYEFLDEFRWSSLIKAFEHAKVMRAWEKLTPIQKDSWYTSGDGRTYKTW